MENTIIQLAMAFVGALGYAVMFHLRKQLLFPAALGGFLSWGVYLLATELIEGIFLPCLISAVFASAYAELLARVMKAPATLFLIPAVMPFIPGSSLFYTMSNVVQRNLEETKIYGALTIQYVLAIAMGVSLVWTMCVIVRRMKKKEREY